MRVLIVLGLCSMSWGLRHPRQLSVRVPRPSLLLKQLTDPKQALFPMTEKEEDKQLVLMFENVEVSCKGEVLKKDGVFGFGELQSVPTGYDGLGYSRGSCDDPKKATNGKDNYPFKTSPGSVETIVVLTQPQWGAYYHFVVDSLSRFTWVNEQHPQIVQAKDTYFHTGYTNEQGQAWARLVGIDTQAGDGSRLLEGWWKGKLVLYPPSNKPANGPHGAEPHAIEGMRQLINANAFSGELAAVGPKKTALLIHRNGDARSLTNEHELIDAMRKELSDWDIAVHKPEHNIKETCEMFHRANMVVGPHGAGFANLLCTNKGTPVVEIQQYPHAHDFELLTAKLGLPYTGIATTMPHGGTGEAPLEEAGSAIAAANVNLARKTGLMRVASGLYSDNMIVEFSAADLGKALRKAKKLVAK